LQQAERVDSAMSEICPPFIADHGRRSGSSSLALATKGNARGIGSGRNSNPRISELVSASPNPVNTKTTTTLFFRPSSCLCRHLRKPAHSLQPVISISHPKRPDECVERKAQIAEIARRPQRRVFVDAPPPSMFIVGIEDCPLLIIPRPAKPEQPPS
jgi:hypothetical protein